MSWSKKSLKRAMPFIRNKNSVSNVERQKIAVLSDQINTVAQELCDRTAQLKKDLEYEKAPDR